MKSEEIANKLQNYLDGAAKKSNVPSAFLRVEKDDFVWEGASGFIDLSGQTSVAEDTPFFIASVTKTFTATVIMMLHEQGKIDLDSPASDYIPQEMLGIARLDNTDYSNMITVRQLLSHTSGLADYFEDKPKTNEIAFMKIVEQKPDDKWTHETALEYARKNFEMVYEPGKGKKAHYSDTNFLLLGFLIEKVSGKPLSEVYNEMIFKPLEMEHTWLYGKSKPIDEKTPETAHSYFGDIDLTENGPMESIWSDGGLISSSADLMKFNKAVHEKKLFSDESYRKMISFKKMRAGMDYGSGLMRIDFGGFFFLWRGYPDMYGHIGATSTFMYYVPDLELYITGSMNQSKFMGPHVAMMMKIIKLFK